MIQLDYLKYCTWFKYSKFDSLIFQYDTTFAGGANTKQTFSMDAGYRIDGTDYSIIIMSDCAKFEEDNGVIIKRTEFRWLQTRILLFNYMKPK